MKQSDWKWFGCPGHFICARDCRFHLCTLIGDILVSTVGEYLPDYDVREILAKSKGIVLKGKGDERRAEYMKKVGFEEIGLDRRYETMAFKTTGEVCRNPKCNCGLPTIIPEEIEFEGYNTAGEAAKGHMKICLKVSKKGKRNGLRN